MHTVNLKEKFSLFSDHWKQRVVGELNDSQVKIVKIKGEFVWHHHDQEDEMFLVLEGRFRMEFHDRSVWIEKGECIVVPKGVEHRPVAEEEVSVMLFEPASTRNTGNASSPLTAERLERI